MTAVASAMGTITIGTSGFSFDDWVGGFYHERTRKADMLGFYATRFHAVEINSTYYGICWEEPHSH